MSTHILSGMRSAAGVAVLSSSALLGLVACVAGCSPPQPEQRDKTCPAETASPGSCGAAPAWLSEPPAAPEIDGITHNELVRNSLTLEALTANAPLIAFLTSHPLTQETIDAADGDVRASLEDDAHHARELLKYVISCALAPDTSISVPDGEATFVQMKGELGLCADEPPSGYGDWSTQPPSPQCQEIVSACLLARVNAKGYRVPISMRDAAGVLGLAAKVPVQRSYREPGPDRPLIRSLRSLEDCPVDETSNCGWVAQYVGRCDEGSDVTIGVESLAPGPSVQVRVCEGIYACNDRAPGPPPWYSGLLTEGTASVKFRCPSDGSHPGYYSVMVKSADPEMDLPPFDVVATCEAEQGGGCFYPASEAQVFTFAEGAFYGNIFGSQKKKGEQCLYDDDLMLYDRQFACYSPAWEADGGGGAHLNDRFCTDPDTPCFGNAPGMCTSDACESDQDCSTTGGCAELASAPASAQQPIYASCHGAHAAAADGCRWQNTATVYLNHPCDFAAQPCSTHCAGASY